VGIVLRIEQSEWLVLRFFLFHLTCTLRSIFFLFFIYSIFLRMKSSRSHFSWRMYERRCSRCIYWVCAYGPPGNRDSKNLRITLYVSGPVYHSWAHTAATSLIPSLFRVSQYISEDVDDEKYLRGSVDSKLVRRGFHYSNAAIKTFYLTSCVRLQSSPSYVPINFGSKSSGTESDDSTINKSVRFKKLAEVSKPNSRLFKCFNLL
jgi:hypothetical protein